MTEDEQKVRRAELELAREENEKQGLAAAEWACAQPGFIDLINAMVRENTKMPLQTIYAWMTKYMIEKSPNETLKESTRRLLNVIARVELGEINFTEIPEPLGTKLLPIFEPPKKNGA